MEITPSSLPSSLESEEHCQSPNKRTDTFQTNGREESFPKDRAKSGIDVHKFAKSKMSDTQPGNRYVSFDKSKYHSYHMEFQKSKRDNASPHYTQRARKILAISSDDLQKQLSSTQIDLHS